jgi:aryl-alcohol dehydrogenase-like predicted oxidoreductase
VAGYEFLQQQLTDRDRIAKVARLESIAKDMGATLAQFALAWCLQNPWVSSVITGASRAGQVEENMKALQFVEKFTPELMETLDEIFLNQSS